MRADNLNFRDFGGVSAVFRGHGFQAAFLNGHRPGGRDSIAAFVAGFDFE